MRTIARVILLLMAAGVGCGGQRDVHTDLRSQRAKEDTRGTVELADAPRVLTPAVRFLSTPPHMDGKLDPQLHDLASRPFTRVWKSDPDNPDVPCHYRLAYGTDFFYVYVEADAESLTYRDRAFQNGDGFSMLISATRPDDEPTEEFYVLSCSAVNRPSLEWTRRIFWYYNVDTIFLRTSDETRLEFRAADGKISFELLLPWKDVRPYHPWISEGIGFNLRFVKAVGETGRNRYKVNPGTIGAENMPRWYARLPFEDPVVESGPQTHVVPRRGNLSEGEACGAVAVTVAPRELTEQVTVGIRGEEHGVVREARAAYGCRRGLTRHEFEVLSGDLASDDYQWTWRARESRTGGEWEVTVLPSFDAEAMKSRLKGVEERISPGSLTTLEFNIERAATLLTELPPYEIASYERRVLLRLNERLDQVHRGEDPYARQTGYIRRAFRSRLDDTLQPYLVRVPEDFDPSQTYPLVVYLHGSASDETDLIGHGFISRGNVIEVAPFGRGPSNGFATTEAQVDIAEAIEDAVANYPVDRDRMVLTGFSMGGYGAYRTFYETPEKFRGVAVFSGSPGFSMDDAPDFRDEDRLRPFRGIPVFVYHGEMDRNVPVRGAAEMVEKLRAAGAEVELKIEAGKGHEAPSQGVIDAYQRWLDEILGE